MPTLLGGPCSLCAQDGDAYERIGAALLPIGFICLIGLSITMACMRKKLFSATGGSASASSSKTVPHPVHPVVHTMQMQTLQPTLQSAGGYPQYAYGQPQMATAFAQPQMPMATAYYPGQPQALPVATPCHAGGASYPPSPPGSPEAVLAAPPPLPRKEE